MVLDDSTMMTLLAHLPIYQISLTHLSDCKQVCFAFSGSLPALRATTHYYTGDERLGADITFNLQGCPDWPTSQEGVWQHVCVNLHSCLRSYDDEGQMFQVDSLRFDSGTFWIDEFRVSPGNVEGMYNT